MSAPRTLYVVAGLFAAAGVGLRLAPTPEPGAPVLIEPQAPAVEGRQVAKRASPAALDAIPAGNVFSPTRTSPAERWRPRREEEEKDTTPPPPPKPVEPPIRLFGITRGPAGTVALIEADPKIPGAELYRLGDKVRGAPITAITDRTVTLGPPRSQVLKLEREGGDR